MRVSPFDIASVRTSADVADVMGLLREYAASLPVDLAYQDFESELATLPGAYGSPSGALLVARDGTGRSLGCVGMRAQNDAPGCCEMKRLYVSTQARGLGLGRALVRCIIAKAVGRGYRTMRLDTLPTMTEAIAMYRSMGFRPVAPYYDTAPPGTLFMAIDMEHPSGFAVRRASMADVADVVRIWYEGWCDAHIGNVPDGLLRYRQREHFDALAGTRLESMWVADVAGSVAGFTVVKDNEIEQLYVARQHRGTGVASALMAQGETEIRLAGHDHAWLAVVAGNGRGRAFYARCGWQDAGPMSYQAQTADGVFPVPTHRYERDLRHRPGDDKAPL